MDPYPYIFFTAVRDGNISFQEIRDKIRDFPIKTCEIYCSWRYI